MHKPSLFLLSLIFLLPFSFTHAQSATSTGTVVATINVTNAKILSQKDRDFSISFDISNKIGAQPQVKYDVRLTKNDTTVDEKVYDEVLSLAENTSITKTIDYSAPQSLSAGKYKVWIDSKNQNGLMLGIALVSEVTLATSTANSIQIVPDSCSLIVGSEKYPSSQSVSIGAESTITAKCKVTSNYKTQLSLVPLFVTRNHTSFGDIASTTEGSTTTISIKAGSNDVSVSLPKTSKPQDYNVAFSLVSQDGKVTSNTVYFNYILSGQRGTIQNVVFDKTFYKSGETANLQIFSTQTTGTSTITAIIANEFGAYCSATTSKEISDFSIINLSLPITRDCTNPKAEISLSAGTDILDSNNFQVTTVTTKAAPISTATKIIIAVILLIFVSVLSVLVYKKKHNAVKVLMLVVVLMGVGKIAEAGCTTNYLMFNNLGNTCSASGKQVTLSWSYLQGWGGGNSQDLDCYPNVLVNVYSDYYKTLYLSSSQTAKSLTLDVIPGNLYYWTVENNSGSFSWAGGASGSSFTCYIPYPVITAFFATPNPVAYNGSTVLSFGSDSNDYPCTLSGGNLGTLVFPYNYASDAYNQYPTGNLTSDTAFSFSCTNSRGTVSKSLVVGVLAPPTVTLSAATSTVVNGGSTIVSWSSTNASSCSITKNSSSWGNGTSGSQSSGILTANTTFVISCSNSAGSTVNKSITITVPPYVSITASPTTVASGNSSTISWSSSGAASCDVFKSGTKNAIWSGTSGSQSTGSLLYDGTYAVYCTSSSGVTNSKSVTVSVSSLSASITASPTTVASGNSSMISWSSAGVTSCSITRNGVSWVSGISGSRTSDAISTSTAFELSCTGSIGNASSSVTVTSVDAPVINISADPVTVKSGNSSTISWSSSGATSCDITRSGSSWASGLSGSQTATNITSTTTFALSCSGDGGTSNKSVVVGITPAKPTPTLNADESEIEWIADEAVSCTLQEGDSDPVSVSTSSSISTYEGGIEYVLECKYDDNTVQSVSITSVDPVVTAKCSASQNYVNQNTVWTVTLSTSTKPTSVEWSGTDIPSTVTTSGLTYNKIYTTVGSKKITAKVKGSKFTTGCSTTTVMKLDDGSNTEF